MPREFIKSTITKKKLKIKRIDFVVVVLRALLCENIVVAPVRILKYDMI